MDIDLLITPNGEAGLLSSKNLIKKALGILFDTDNGTLSIEFADMDHLTLNIPVERDLYDSLDSNARIHIGSIKEGKIAQAYQVPLMFLDDPYRAEAFKNRQDPIKPLAAFYYFIKNCRLGQPVHRNDAGNEDTSGCILGDTAPASLEFAKHLARRHGIEAATAATTGLNAPGMGLGGGSSSGGGGINTGSGYHRSDYDKDDDKE